jgi:hypothetical protein
LIGPQRPTGGSSAAASYLVELEQQIDREEILVGHGRIAAITRNSKH